MGLLYFSILASAQDRDSFVDHINDFLLTDKSTVNTEVLHTYMEKIEKKKLQYRSDIDFLQFLFSKTHSKFLKTYQDHSSFSELLHSGEYNCLTGTALYGLLLDYFNYDFEMIETNYHIFITISVEGRTILFETTDPLNGFVTSPKEIEERIMLYKKNIPVGETDKSREQYIFTSMVYHPVRLEELTGLLYYNQAVEAFNQRNIIKSIDLLDKATQRYKSSRIEEFSKVVLSALQNFDLNTSEKQAYAKKISSLFTL